MILSKELLAQIEELQHLSGKKMELKDLLQSLVEKELKRLKADKGITAKRSQPQAGVPNPPQSKQSPKAQQAAQAPAVCRSMPKARPYTSRAPKNQLWQRSKGSCELIDFETGITLW